MYLSPMSMPYTQCPDLPHMHIPYTPKPISVPSPPDARICSHSQCSVSCLLFHVFCLPTALCPHLGVPILLCPCPSAHSCAQPLCSAPPLAPSWRPYPRGSGVYPAAGRCARAPVCWAVSGAGPAGRTSKRGLGTGAWRIRPREPPTAARRAPDEAAGAAAQGRRAAAPGSESVRRAVAAPAGAKPQRRLSEGSDGSLRLCARLFHAPAPRSRTAARAASSLRKGEKGRALRATAAASIPTTGLGTRVPSGPHLGNLGIFSR